MPPDTFSVPAPQPRDSQARRYGAGFCALAILVRDLNETTSPLLGPIFDWERFSRGLN